MTARLYLVDPGLATHSAKNAPTRPGLPKHSEDRSERTTMLNACARLFTRADSVTYTPEALNQLIDDVVSREVANRIGERADWHRRAAAMLGDDPVQSAWHRCEAFALDQLATRPIPAFVEGVA